MLDRVERIVEHLLRSIASSRRGRVGGDGQREFTRWPRYCLDLHHSAHVGHVVAAILGWFLPDHRLGGDQQSSN